MGNSSKNEELQPKFRRRRLMRRGLALFAITAGLLFSSCRKQRMWSGMDFVDHGKTLQLAAYEPLCGCLDAINVSNQPIYLRSRTRTVGSLREPEDRGHRVLLPGEEMKESFDWGGRENQVVYDVDAWSADGKQLVIWDVLRINGYGWPFTACHLSQCKVGPLFMNAGALGQR